MNNQEYLLTCLAEECLEIVREATELGQRATKALRFGLDEVQDGQLLNNKQRLVQEVIDLMAVLEMLADIDVLDFSDFAGRILEKKFKIEKYKTLATNLGTLKF